MYGLGSKHVFGGLGFAAHGLRIQGLCIFSGICLLSLFFGGCFSGLGLL